MEIPGYNGASVLTNILEQKYPITVDGELELARNVYAHWQQHKSIQALLVRMIF